MNSARLGIRLEAAISKLRADIYWAMLGQTFVLIAAMVGLKVFVH